MLLPLMLWMYRRWHDWAFLTIALLFEVSVFGISSKIVGRDRPPVEQLDGAPTASWPSGHIAASVVFYVGPGDGGLLAHPLVGVARPCSR